MLIDHQVALRHQNACRVVDIRLLATSVRQSQSVLPNWRSVKR